MNVSSLPSPDVLDRLIADYGADRVSELMIPLISESRIARIDQVLDARLASLTAMVEDTYDPHNASAAIRTVEGLGLGEFHVVQTEGRFAANKGITRGCHRWLDFHKWPNVAAGADSLRARGFKVYATLPGAKYDLETLDLSNPVALVFGNEHAGLSPEAIAACDGAVAIPMHGFTQSFNLSVSVGLAMAHLAARRRRMLAAEGRNGDLTDERRRDLRARWFAVKIEGAAEIIARAVAKETRASVAAQTQI